MNNIPFPLAIDSTMLGSFRKFQAIRNGVLYDVLIDPEDWDRVKTRSWHVTEKGYVRAHGEYLHRFLMGNKAPEYDHSNKDKLDNRKANLIPCTHAQNMENKGEYRNNTSGRKGVSFYSKTGKWRAFINIKGTHKVLGYFKKFEEAVQARQEAEVMRGY